MSRHTKWIIEFVVVSIVIILLLMIGVPKFLRSQRQARISYLSSDLEYLMKGIKTYYLDYKQLPYLFYPGNNKNVQPPAHSAYILVENVSATSLFQFKEMEFELYQTPLIKFLDHLDHIGIIDENPTFLMELDDITPSNSFTYYFHALSISTESKQTINWGMAIVWPYASMDNKSVFERMYLKRPMNFYIHPGYTKRYIEFDPSLSINNSNDIPPLIQPDVFYAPSNGLQSAGFVYLDLYGNRSPIAD